MVKSCPRLYPDSKMLKQEKGTHYDYWSAQQVYFKGNIVQKGFDTTEVNSKLWKVFKKKYSLKLVRKSPKGSKHHVFFSKKNCAVVVTGMEDKESNQLTLLSSMRFETPKNRSGTLERMIKDFRGSKSLKGTDKNIQCLSKSRSLSPRCPAATYIKEEDKLTYPPKSYESFI